MTVLELAEWAQRLADRHKSFMLVCRQDKDSRNEAFHEGQMIAYQTMAVRLTNEAV